MARKRTLPPPTPPEPEWSLARFTCPNPDCVDFNRFDAGNLSICEWTGKHKHIRRLYCDHCGQRFSERRGSLLQDAKLPEAAVVRLVKCLTHGCSIEAAADICDVDPRTVERLLRKAGVRAEDFHRLQLERLSTPPPAVELDEMHGRVCETAAEKGGYRSGAGGVLSRVAARVARGFTWPWRRSAGS